MSAQLRAAFVRALIVGFFTALLTFLTNLQQGQPSDKAMLAAAIAWVGVILARGFGEGQYDASREKNNDVRPSDVGYSAE